MHLVRGAIHKGGTVNTQSLFLQFLTTVIYWCGMVMFFIGLAIVIAPAQVIRIGEVMNRWVSTDQAFHDLDAPRPTERLFYRHHRWFGGLLTLGAAYVLYSFAFAIDYGALSKGVLLFNSRAATEWLVYSLSFLNIGFSVLAILLGVIIFFRPSLLKRLEWWANRWYGVDDSLKKLDVQLRAPDSWFRKRPRLLGLMIVAGGLYIVTSLSLFVRS